MSENPYAAAPVEPSAETGDPDDRNLDRTLLSPAYDLLAISGVLVAISFGIYAILSLYNLSMARIYLQQVNGTPAVLFFLGILEGVIASGLCLYGSYRIWRYRGAVLSFMRYQINWQAFTSEHTGYFRAYLVMVGIGLGVRVLWIVFNFTLAWQRAT